MNPRHGVRVALAVLVAMLLSACAQPDAGTRAGGPTSASPSATAGESAQTVSRIRVVNDSMTDLKGLVLWFPEDEVLIGDVAAGATSGYVKVPNGVYNYSAFRQTREDEEIIQPVIDFVGERPLPRDDYTYLLGVDPDSEYPIELLSVLRAAPTVEDATDSLVVWAQVRNEGPDDLVGYSMRFPDGSEIHFGSIPAGTTSQFTRLFGGGLRRHAAVSYTEDGREVSQPFSATDALPQESEVGVVTYVVGYERAAPPGEHLRQAAVLVHPETDRE